MPTDLPSNVHVSKHPLLRAKLSLLRSSSTSARDTKALINDIATILAVEALASGLNAKVEGTDTSSLKYEYPVETVVPQRISVMPILRSGLAMVDAVQQLLPIPVPVHHLGLFRDKATLSAVEYYNNLPYRTTYPTATTTTATSSASSDTPRPGSASASTAPSDLTILLDPIIATGATACAAIDTLRDWGVKRVIMLSVLGSAPGLQQAAEQWPEGVEIWTGGVDADVDGNGMIKPGLGDVGDRLFLTVGK